MAIGRAKRPNGVELSCWLAIVQYEEKRDLVTSIGSTAGKLLVLLICFGSKHRCTVLNRGTDFWVSGKPDSCDESHSNNARASVFSRSDVPPGFCR